MLIIRKALTLHFNLPEIKRQLHFSALMAQKTAMYVCHDILGWAVFSLKSRMLSEFLHCNLVRLSRSPLQMRVFGSSFKGRIVLVHTQPSQLQMGEIE